jgi:MFS transporter, DHA2 family, methylenomycin A resistance protein
MTLQRASDLQTDTPRLQTNSSTGMATLVALAMGFVMATLDVTVVNVAAADLQNKLDITLASLTWVVDGYILSFASLLLAGGSLANRYGAKTVYMGGLTLFVLASLLCALAPSGAILVTGRLLQGVGAAFFMPSSLSLLAYAYPDEKKRAKMFGIWSAIVSVASGLGPFIGGVLVEACGWRSIFFINLPIGILGLFMTHRVVPLTPRAVVELHAARHAWGMIALAGLCYALIEGPSHGWTSPSIIGAVCLAAAAAILFLHRERRAAAPIIPVRLRRDSRFVAANAVGFLINFGLFGGTFMLSLFLQKAREASPFAAGVQLLPMMLVFVAGNLLFARLTPRLGARLPMLASLAVAGIGSLLLVAISPATPYWLLAVVLAAVNLAVGVAVPAMTAAVMQASGLSDANMAGAILNANRQMGALFGVAVMGVVLHESADWYRGASLAFLITGIAYMTAGGLVWRLIRTS